VTDKGDNIMKLQFIWKGDPTGDLETEEIERGIAKELEENFKKLISKSATVNLTYDVRKAVVLGIVVSAGKQVINISHKSYENKTTVVPL
jgi:hypothetical protein